MAQKIYLVIGAAGQLGHDLMRVFGSRGRGFTHRDLEITKWEAVWEKIRSIKPAVVVNTAAFHKVEECERQPEQAYAVNVLGAYYIARAAKEVGAAMVYVSTDYVFGDEKEVYRETDCPRPLNVYGASKLAGEELTRITNPRSYIVRTSALFGIKQSGKGYNFVTLMLKLAKKNQEIKVVNDQFTAPTYTLDLAQKIKELVERPAPFGVYHITNQGGCSWYELAKTIFKKTDTPANLKPISSAERPANLVRPRSTILKNQALMKLGIKPMRPWSEGFMAYLLELEEKTQ